MMDRKYVYIFGGKILLKTDIYERGGKEMEKITYPGS
jgi:hypothetical protein